MESDTNTWKSVRQFLIKLDIHPNRLNNPTPINYLREMEIYVHKKNRTGLFMITLFITAQHWKQSQLEDGQIVVKSPEGIQHSNKQEPHNMQQCGWISKALC